MEPSPSSVMISSSTFWRPSWLTAGPGSQWEFTKGKRLFSGASKGAAASSASVAQGDQVAPLAAAALTRTQPGRQPEAVQLHAPAFWAVCMGGDLTRLTCAKGTAQCVPSSELTAHMQARPLSAGPGRLWH